MKKHLLLVTLTNILIFNTLSAQKTWVGGTSINWATANNWNPTGVPSASNNVTVGSGSPNNCLINSSVSRSGTTSLTGTGISIGGASAVLTNTGAIIAASNVSTSIQDNGTLTNNSGGTMSYAGSNGALLLLGGTINNNTGASMTFTTSSYLQLDAGTTFNNSGGTLNLNSSYLYIDGTLINSGTINNTNAIITGFGTFSGSLFTNPLGATLGDAALGINNCLTFSNGLTNAGTMLFQIGGTTACTQRDNITVTGTATLGGTFSVQLNNSYNPPLNTTFDVLTATAISGTFTNNSINLGGGKYANMYYTATKAYIKIESSVPVACTNPTAYSVTGTGAYCTGGSGVAVGLSNSETGVTYQLKNGGANVGSAISGTTGSAISFGNQTTAATYTVLATRTTGGCTATMTGSAVVTNNTPTAYTVTGTSAACPGGTGLAPGLSNSQTGVSYQLKNGAVNVGNAVNGTTSSSISFGTQPAGTYTVVATLSGCTATMTGNAVVSTSTGSVPTTFAVTGGGSFCAGGTGVAVGVANSETGVNYQLQNAGSNVGTAVGGTGSAISFPNQTSAATYTVIATTTAGGCTADMSSNAVVSVNTVPAAYNITGTGAYCTGGAGLAVGLANSETGVTYQLKNGAANVGSAISGTTGSAISFGSQTTAATYTVLATKTTSGCTATMTGSAVITANALPTAYNVTGTGSYCSGGAGVAVGLANSETGVNYQLKNGAANVGSAISGTTGLAINFGNQTTAATYTVLATRTTGGCTATMTGSAVVSVDAEPTAYNVTGTGAYCSGGTGVAIGLSNSETGITYQLKNGAANVGTAISGTTGSAISFGNQTTVTTYTVIATRTTGGCTATMTGNAVVTVNTNPTLFTVTGTGTYCIGDLGVVLGLSGSQLGVSYQLKDATNSTVGNFIGTGNSLSFGLQTVGTYTVVGTSFNNCAAIMTGNAIAGTINCCPSGNTLYVNASVVGGTGDGESWANAYASLSSALKTAHQCSGVTNIKVAAGTYKPTRKHFNTSNKQELSTADGRDMTFHIRSGLTVEGGYNASNNTQDIAANVTILSGDIDNNNTLDNGNAYHVVLISAVSEVASVTIKGFSITGGNANNSSSIYVNSNQIYKNEGAGIITYNGTNTLSNNKLYGNAATGGGGGVRIGSFDATTGVNTLSNNTIYSNTTGSSNGGGIKIDNGTNTLNNNSIYSNTGGIGGGIYVFSGTSTFSNNTIYSNTATSTGGGFSFEDGTNTVINNIIHSNTASIEGGGIYSLYGTQTINNNTIYSNSAVNNGGGIYTNSGTNQLNNNIFWQNKKGTDAGVQGADCYSYTNLPTYKNNILQLASNVYVSLGPNSANNLFAKNPKFTTTTAPINLALQVSSPCINAGIAGAGIPTTDFTGATRVGFSDIGAYENLLTCDCNPVCNALPTTPGTYTATTTNTVDGYTHYCDGSGNLLLSLKMPAGTTIPAAAVRVKVGSTPATFYTRYCGGTDATTSCFMSSSTGNALINRNWHIDPTLITGTAVGLSNQLQVVTYFMTSDYTAMNTALTTNSGSPLGSVSGLKLYQPKASFTGSPFSAINLITPLNITTTLSNGTSAATNAWLHSTYQTIINAAEFKVNSIKHTGGIGKFID